MKRQDLFRIVGILYEEGELQLSQVVARSPLCNVPKPKRRELTFDEYEAKKRREANRYHNMSPAEKRDKVEDTKKRRALEKKRAKERQEVAALFLGNL